MHSSENNPFQYDTANDLDAEEIAEYYVEDFNYGRFIRSRRNVVILGERGSGKTMTLRFNSWELQKLRATKTEESLPLQYLGVYVPCSTPLNQRQEYTLEQRPFEAALLSEHFFVLSIAHAVLDTVRAIPDVINKREDSKLRKEFSYLFSAILPSDLGVLDAMQQLIQRINIQTQHRTNSNSDSPSIDFAFSFSSLILPLLMALHRLKRLADTHYLLLIDDAHWLNEYQARALNSWIAYRDHSLFSFKVAAAKSEMKTMETSSGGTILEGHDYIRLDMEHPYQNEDSDFGKLAAQLVRRRLHRFSIKSSPDDFFPPNALMQEAIAEAAEDLRHEAVNKFGGSAKRKITDYVYKYKRVRYYQTRPAKANLPQLAGWQTIVFLSSGVIRNLLKPCFVMYENARSHLNDTSDQNDPIKCIPYDIQANVILTLSESMWVDLKDNLSRSVADCNVVEALHAYQMMDHLAILFRERMLKHQSEPAANSFTISGPMDEFKERVDKLIAVLRRGQFLYVRPGSAKDRGRRELYYIPNRLLWPARGLDPHGQHARVSIPARDLWIAASKNTAIPSKLDEKPLIAELWHEPA